MNCEDFTYSAHEADYSARYAAGPDEALSPSPHGAYSAGPLSEAVIRFWMWMQLQLSSYLEKAAMPRSPATEPSHIFQLPSSDASAPARTVRVNRSMMRKLLRLQRLYPPSYFEGPSLGDELKRLNLTMVQYIEYMIRCKKWSRVRVYGLGAVKSKSSGQAQERFRLRGRAINLEMAGRCNALLSPD